MKMFAQLTGAAALGFAMMASVPAQATQIIASTTGLASPASTITFDEIVLPTFTIVTNQYAGLGVTFSPGLDYSPQTGFGNVQGADVGNFDASGGKIDGPQTLTFSSVLTGAAFAVASNNSAYLFEALLGGRSLTASLPPCQGITSTTSTAFPTSRSTRSA